MKIMNDRLGGLMVAALFIWAAAMSAATAQPAKTEPMNSSPQEDVVAFCKAHPTLDFPNALFFGQGYDPDATPTQIAKLDEMLKWRCMNGKVWICSDSADGDWCSQKDTDRKPSPVLQQACHEEPNKGSFDFAEEHYSAFDWRCKKGIPQIIKSYPLDRRGFFKAPWVPVIVNRGVIIGPTDFPSGPR